MKKLLHDRILTRNPHEAGLQRAGVPRNCWRVEAETIQYHGTLFMQDQASAAAQRQQLYAVAQEPQRQIIVVASHPTDAGAMRAACWAASRVYAAKFPILIWDVQQEGAYAEKKPRLVVLHNIRGACDDARADAVRDLVLRYHFCARLLVVATAEPYRFCTDRLALRPSGTCLVNDVY